MDPTAFTLSRFSLFTFSRTLRLQDRLHDLAMMHLFEGFVPRFQAPHSAKNGANVELPRAEQRQHTLPNRPVVAETAPQRDVFLDQWIERKVQRLRSPTDLGDPTGRTNQFEGGL